MYVKAIEEKLLIEHCSLTLSSLKTASMFTAKYTNFDDLRNDIAFWNEKFSDKGISVRLLKRGAESALIYLYREDMLIKDMSDLKARKILSQYGYQNLSVSEAIDQLSERFSTYDEFPHEIGLFLGYPPKDVEGFICNGGKNCSLCRYWKVYGEKDEALQKFARYDKCKAVYKRLWQDGMDILRLAVKKQLVA